jgi:adenosylmethionine-8-amino-7-oxononanoate aminotransferase
LSHALFDAGLICRADDRGDPVIQLSPPLTCTLEHFDEMVQFLRAVLTMEWTGICGSCRDDISRRVVILLPAF